MTRGIKKEIDNFITELQGKYLPYEYEKGKFGHLQFSVRPIQMWEFVFPEPQLQVVLNSISPANGFTTYNETYLALARKALRCKKIPDLDPKTISFPISKSHIDIIPIGIKEDRIREIGTGKEGPVGEGCEVI